MYQMLLPNLAKIFVDIVNVDEVWMKYMINVWMLHLMFQKWPDTCLKRPRNT